MDATNRRGGTGIAASSNPGRMENPWLDLPAHPDYVLPIDAAAVEAVNTGLQASPDAKLQLGVLPEPFIGRPDASIVVLNLNPGFGAGDGGAKNIDANLYAAIRANLRHEAISHPFYYLNPEFADSGGYKWWNSRLDALIVASSRERVAENLLCAEWCPYASTTAGAIRGTQIPSSAYTFQLVRKALEREAVVILFRSEQLWLSSIPKLASYRSFYKVKNPRNPSISQTNCPEGYLKALRALKS